MPGIYKSFAGVSLAMDEYRNSSPSAEQAGQKGQDSQADLPPAYRYRPKSSAPHLQQSAHKGGNLAGVYVRAVKRMFDIVFGLVAMPFLLVLLVVLGIAIKAEDGGPVFYNASRVGKDGREFLMYKFRSMKVNSPDLVFADGSTYNAVDDPRMTRVGRMMRRTSVDEFPQFLNVLGGTMSLIGPRPDLKRETELYEGNEGDKLLVKPGITGYSAVYGGRNASLWHDRLALDVWYVHHVNFCLDVKIFFKTFQAIFSQEGVFAEPEGGVDDTHMAE